MVASTNVYAQSGGFAGCFSREEFFNYHVENFGLTATTPNAKREQKDNYVFTVDNLEDVTKIIDYLKEQMGPPPVEYGIETVNKLEYIALATGSGMLLFYSGDCSHNRATKMPVAAFMAIYSYVDASPEKIVITKVADVFKQYGIKSETY